MISDIFINDMVKVLETYKRNKGANFYIPGSESFKLIINTAFFTSLKKEEGNSIKFSLLMINVSNEDEFINNNNVLRFDLNFNYKIDNLVKIAPAHDADQSVLVVSIDETTLDINIVGLMAIKNNYDENLLNAINDGCRIKSIPDNVILSALDLGQLQVSVSSTDIGKMIDGQFVMASRSSFSDISLGYHLKKPIVSHELYKQFGKNYWDLYRTIVTRLLTEAASRGHGSTIVILDSSNIDDARNYYEPRYKFRDTFDLNSLILKALEDGIDSENCVENANKIIDNIVLFAQLATVDGALIMTNNLEFESFGATLTAPQWDFDILTGPDGFGNGAGRPYLSKRLGTRHNSAIAFAGKCKGSCVFVISHDGPIRAFITSDEYVLCWPNCTL